MTILHSLVKYVNTKRHEKQQNFECPDCNFTAEYQSRLSKHIEVKHSGKQNLRVQCNVCCQSFEGKSTLQVHKKRLHSGNQTKHNCNLCDFQSIYKGSLKNHLINVHRKPYL